MKFIKKRDILVIAAIAVLGAAIWFLFGGAFSKQGSVAEIYYRTQLVKTVALTPGKGETFSLEQDPAVVFSVYPDGSIAFIESDCRDKICVKSGRLHLTGQTAACLPNQVYVKIVSTGPETTDGPDIVIS